MPEVTELERAMDALYGAPLEGFVEERAALEKRLRASGQAAAAARVKALPKPTVSAWLVNQLYRHHAAAFRELLAAGEALRAAQATVLRGEGRAALDEAFAREKRALAELLRLAREAGGQAARLSPAVLDRVRDDLRALARSDAAFDGRLSRDLPTPGLDTWFAGGAPATGPEARRSSSAAARSTAPSRPAGGAARVQAERERAEQERAEQERAEQERAEQERAEQERAEQERAEQERAERERAERERQAELERQAAARVLSARITRDTERSRLEHARTEFEEIERRHRELLQQVEELTVEQSLRQRQIEQLGASLARAETELKSAEREQRRLTGAGRPRRTRPR